MAFIEFFTDRDTRRSLLLRGALRVLYGQRGVRFTRNGSITAPRDDELASSVALRYEVADILESLVPKVGSAEAGKSVPLVRAGGDGDGGYFVFPQEIKAAVSAGTASDDSFDLALADTGAMVLQVDNSQDAAPSTHKNLRFMRATVGESPGALGLQELRAIHERLFEYVDTPGWLLKLDIEGSEWGLLAEVEDLDDWDQLVVELHDLDRLSESEFAESARRAIRNLRRHHVPICIRGNSGCGFVVLGGIPVPRVVEVTFAHRRLWLIASTTEPQHKETWSTFASVEQYSNVQGLANLWLWGLSPRSAP